MTGFPLFDQSEEHGADPEFEGWMEQGDAPIVITAGSANLHGEAFYGAALTACRRLGRRALLITQNRDLLPDALPAEALHRPYMPFSRVLPKAAALLSHGGIGTCAQALAAGVPHLVRPLAFDQLDNASRLEDLGVGACLPAGRISARRMERRLGDILSDDSRRESCRAVREKMQSTENVLAEVCDLIVER